MSVQTNSDAKNSARKNQQLIDSSDYLGPAASAMDYTGLIPSGLTVQAELESYEEMYSFIPVKESSDKH